MHVVEFDGCYWHACEVCVAGQQHYRLRGGLGCLPRETRKWYVISITKFWTKEDISFTACKNVNGTISDNNVAQLTNL